ncbi:hypothetical protein BRADI_4g38682v3 [Brachypodium distachyon]|uniref:Uncharacterized protein n=1 Tax=Brachypodium distachyon TaxID=15368 RepID=A0A2K2CT48_BRADI|nr:hypothetical protein BRADI_4g38682v3 [Brachypodium distachyon]
MVRRGLNTPCGHHVSFSQDRGQLLDFLRIFFAKSPCPSRSRGARRSRPDGDPGPLRTTPLQPLPRLGCYQAHNAQF